MSDVDPLLDLLRTATKAAVEEALRRRMPVLRPGTVTQYDVASQVCSVLIDGDTDETPGIPNYTGHWTWIGERVLVEFRPPSGIGVSRIMRPPGGPSITVHGRALTTALAGATIYLPFDTVEGVTGAEVFEVTTGPTSAVAALRVNLRGRWRMMSHISHTSAIAGRRFMGFAVNEVPGTPGGVVDLQTGATGVFVGNASRPINLEAGDLVQVRTLGPAGTGTVESFSLEWMGHGPPT